MEFSQRKVIYGGFATYSHLHVYPMLLTISHENLQIIYVAVVVVTTITYLSVSCNLFHVTKYLTSIVDPVCIFGFVGHLVY